MIILGYSRTVNRNGGYNDTFLWTSKTQQLEEISLIINITTLIKIGRHKIFNSSLCLSEEKGMLKIMNLEEIRHFVDEFQYNDARIKKLECNYFSDEVILIHEFMNGFDLSYHFMDCIKVKFVHDINYNKLGPVKNMTYAHLPYFMQDIILGNISINGEDLIIMEIIMYPLNLEIWCKNIEITEVNRIDTDEKKCFEF